MVFVAKIGDLISEVGKLSLKAIHPVEAVCVADPFRIRIDCDVIHVVYTVSDDSCQNRLEKIRAPTYGTSFVEEDIVLLYMRTVRNTH